MIVPQEIVQLQARFRSHLRQNSGTTPFLKQKARAEVQELLAQGAPFQKVADTLFLGLVDHWLSLRDRDFGIVTTTAWYPVTRLSEALAEGPFVRWKTGIQKLFYECASYRGSNLFSVIEFSSEADQYHQVEEPVLEVIQSGIGDGLGFNFFEVVHEHGLEVRGRMTTLSHMELGLQLLYPDRGLRFCVVPDLVSVSLLNRLHFYGYQPIAMDLQSRSVHPVETVIHDVAHLSRWGKLSVELRQAASLFGLSLLAILDKSSLHEISYQKKIVSDLEFVREQRPFEAFLEIVHQVGSRIGERKRHLATHYLDGINAYFTASESAEIQQLRDFLRCELREC